MMQLAQYQDGRLELQEVPQPLPPPGGILVRLTHSVISVGTERMKVEQAKMNLLQKARARPDQVRKVLDSARTLGWRSALEKVRNRLEMPSPLGYSAAGVVHAVDASNTRFRLGDRVAIGGAECAFHAQYAAVPDMLAAQVPEGVANWQAAYTTIASIALQAVRQLDARLGERVLVLGQGLVGLLVTAFLRASGVRVMAVDVAAARGPFSKAMGAEVFVFGREQELSHHVRTWTQGYGADAVVLATSSTSNAPTEQALQALRDRGRMVVVGKTKVDLDWNHAYEKEIDVRYSRSYGPGRYDPSYEWAGADYPIPYVRWTEQRNFDACLYLMRAGVLDVGALTTRRVPFSRALDAYERLLGADGASEVGVVLEYADDGAEVHEHAEARRPAPSAAPAPRALPVPDRLEQKITRLDVIGAGNFARTMLLPHLKGKVPFGTVVNSTALSANHARTKFGFAAASTAAADVFEERDRTAVLIATRHHLHAPLVLSALAGHRHVFVEKPLCLAPEELEQIETALTGSRGTLQVGFNRRFAPAAQELRRLLAQSPGPKVASFRVMAGVLDPSHWYANLAESGGRALGEACHFLDFLCFLFAARPRRVIAQPVGPASARVAPPDGVAAQIEFDDGSCGQLIYSAEGDATWPKEVCTVYAAGLTAEIENFQRLTVSRGRKRATRRFSGKGHAEQMAAWAAFLNGERAHPVPFEEAYQSMRLTFALLDSIRAGHAVHVMSEPQARRLPSSFSNEQ
jgi:predicted dehydrogenase/threonine dehydrogenase-like Zn-dependent dehydrogenase